MNDRCLKCQNQDWVDGFPEGDRMFKCQAADDPRMPFDIAEDGSNCPCFKPFEKDDEGHYTCKYCGADLEEDYTIREEYDYDGTWNVTQRVRCPDCGAAFIRISAYNLVLSYEEIETDEGPIDDEDRE